MVTVFGQYGSARGDAFLCPVPVERTDQSKHRIAHGLYKGM